MFCNKCGAKISPGANRCEFCGTPAEFAEYCGGFWGLVGQTSPSRVAVVINDVTTQSSENEMGVPRNAEAPAGSNRKRVLIPIALCLVFAGLFTVQTLRISGLQDEVGRQKGYYNRLYQTSGSDRTDMQEQIDQLSDDVDAANKTNLELESQVAQLTADLDAANTLTTRLQAQLDAARTIIASCQEADSDDAFDDSIAENNDDSQTAETEYYYDSSPEESPDDTYEGDSSEFEGQEDNDTSEAILPPPGNSVAEEDENGGY